MDTRMDENLTGNQAQELIKDTWDWERSVTALSEPHKEEETSVLPSDHSVCVPRSWPSQRTQLCLVPLMMWATQIAGHPFVHSN